MSRIILGALIAIAFSFLASDVMAQKNNVVAHRGTWKNTNVPQNSLAALKHAIDQKCLGSEFDVHMTSDGVPVVNHDHTIGQIDIEKVTLAQLQADFKHKNGEVIPTLESYLLAGKGQKKTTLVLEIKTSRLGKERSLELTEKCVALVKKLKMEKIVDYIAFDYDVCKKVKELDPKAHVAYLSGNVAPAQLKADNIDGFDYHYSVLKKNENWIQEAKDLKLTTNVWTVNDKATMEWFLERNFDFITTDEPELLLELIKARK